MNEPLSFEDIFAAVRAVEERGAPGPTWISTIQVNPSAFKDFSNNLSSEDENKLAVTGIEILPDDSIEDPKMLRVTTSKGHTLDLMPEKAYFVVNIVTA